MCVNRDLWLRRQTRVQRIIFGKFNRLHASYTNSYIQHKQYTDNILFPFHIPHGLSLAWSRHLRSAWPCCRAVIFSLIDEPDRSCKKFITTPCPWPARILGNVDMSGTCQVLQAQVYIHVLSERSKVNWSNFPFLGRNS